MNREEALRKPAGRDAQLISLPEGVVVNRDNKIRYPDPGQRQHMKLFGRKQMPKFEDMTDEQLEEVLQGCFRSMNSLMVCSQIPAEHRAEYRQYQRSVAVIEAEQEKRYQAHPTIAMQDTTHYVW